MKQPVLAGALLGAMALIVIALSRPDPVTACGVPAATRSAEGEPDGLDAGQVAFAGYGWNVRGYDGLPTSVGSWDPRLVSIRDDGALVLRQASTNGQWFSSEVHSIREGFGYGTYRWAVESPLHHLDPQVVLGLFTYEAGVPGNREIDIEFARWGRPDGDNLYYTVWDDAKSTRSRFVGETSPTEHLFTWMPGKVRWCSQDARGREIASAEVATDLEPGAERIHMNLWISGSTAPRTETEVVITNFSFVPADTG